MPDIDIIRPTSTPNNTAPWTIHPSGTAHGVTSDDSDSTYVKSVQANVGFIRFASPHTPAANHQRHRVRARVKTRADDTAISTGILIAPTSTGTGWQQAPYASTPLNTTIRTFTGPWRQDAFFRLNTVGALSLGWISRPQSVGGIINEVRALEAYIDVDCRHEPTFTGDVVDAAGVSQDGGTVTDTNQPHFTFENVDLDQLTARTWRIVITDTDAGTVVSDLTFAGPAPSEYRPDPLPNANYSVVLTVTSTIRIDDAFDSDPTTLTFEVDFVAPAEPILTIVANGCSDDVPNLEVCWEEGTPTANTFDPGQLLELWRQDCTGLYRILVSADVSGCWCDRFAPFDKPGFGCSPGPMLSLGAISSGAWTTDIAFAGDIDVRATIVPSNIGQQPITFELPQGTIASQLGSAGNLSWAFFYREGSLVWLYSANGTAFTAIWTTEPLDVDPGTEITVRVTHDVNDGAGSRQTIFYISRDGLNWDVIGDPVTFGSSGTLFNSTARVQVGNTDAGNNDQQFYGGIKNVEIRSSIGGTVVANPDFTTWAKGQTTKADAAGKTWTLEGAAEIDDAACAVIYQARYWGIVDGAVVSTPWEFAYPEVNENPSPDDHWLRGVEGGDVAICLTDRSYPRVRPFGAFQPIGGGIPTVITGNPGGRDYTLSFTCDTEGELVDLEAVLAQQLFLYQPTDQVDVWLAPAAESVEMVKVGRKRRLTVTCVAVEPQPVADPVDTLS